MEKFAGTLPRTQEGEAVQLMPAVDTIAHEYAAGELDTSQEIALDPSTVYVELNTLNQAVVMKEGQDNATIADGGYNRFCHADSTIHIAVKQGVTHMNFLSHSAGGAASIIEYKQI